MYYLIQIEMSDLFRGFTHRPLFGLIQIFFHDPSYTIQFKLHLGAIIFTLNAKSVF